MRLQKLKYYMACSRKWLIQEGFVCPSCGHEKSTVVDRRYFVTALRRCNNCELLFRTPTDTKRENEAFYQEAYSEYLSSNFTTDMPSVEKLNAFKQIAFKGTKKDFSAYINVLDALGCKPENSLLDFGCSWGYGSWQFSQAGYLVKAYEISKPRCNYAKQYLGIDAYSSLDELTGTFDIFFSAHVLEHVPCVRETINYGWQKLRPGGLFVAFTPNGSEAHQMKNPAMWHSVWGRIHPSFLDDIYYKKAFDGYPMIITSIPYPLDMLKQWTLTGNGCETGDLSGHELLIAVRKPKY